MIEEVFAKGGPVMWCLLCCSVAAGTILLERSVFWGIEFVRSWRWQVRSGSAKCRPPAYMRVQHFHQSASPEASVGASQQLERIVFQGLPMLNTIITIAPLFGILGTVLGIIESFDLLHSAGVRNPQAIIGGVAQALLTTAAGLGVALVAIVGRDIFTLLGERQLHRLQMALESAPPGGIISEQGRAA